MPTDSNQEIVDEFPPLCEVTLNSKEASTLPVRVFLFYLLQLYINSLSIRMYNIIFFL